jgi:hypothetical protein
MPSGAQPGAWFGRLSLRDSEASSLSSQLRVATRDTDPAGGAIGTGHMVCEIVSEVSSSAVAIRAQRLVRECRGASGFRLASTTSRGYNTSSQWSGGAAFHGYGRLSGNKRSGGQKGSDTAPAAEGQAARFGIRSGPIGVGSRPRPRQPNTTRGWGTPLSLEQMAPCANPFAPRLWNPYHPEPEPTWPFAHCRS